MNLLIATQNAHKLHEIESILCVPGLRLYSMRDYPDLPEVDEDGHTFVDNARKKAVTLAAHTGLWAMADDSGLEVAALHGQPGVRSARYAGEPVDYRANNRKLLAALAGVTDRRARFRTVVALSSPAGDWRSVEGVCGGVIGREERGDCGFGYDPLFVPDGYDCTFAEMEPELKNRISHRADALRRACETWRGLLSGRLAHFAPDAG